MQVPQHVLDANAEALLQDPTLFGTAFKVLIFAADNLSAQVAPHLRGICQLLTKEQPQIAFDIFQAFYQLFLKENVTGPSYYHTDSDQKLAIERELRKQYIPRMETQQINQQHLEQLHLTQYVTSQQVSTVSIHSIYKTQADLDFIEEELSLGGEQFKSVIALKQLFITCKYLLQALLSDTQESIYYLWWARINFMHNEFLDTPVHQLKDVAIDSFNTYLKLSSVNKQHNPVEMALLHVEFSYTYIISTISTVKQNNNYKLHSHYLKLDLNYQVRWECGLSIKNPRLLNQSPWQLKMNWNNKNVIPIYYLVNQLPQVTQMLQEYLQFAPTQVQLEEDTILYEKPNVDEEVLKNERSDMKLEEQVLLLGYVHHLKKTTAGDEILQQQIGAYMNLMLDKSRNWVVYSQGLLLRSLNEYTSLKRMDRALAQMQVLADQFNDPQPPHSTRITLYFPVNYPDFYKLSSILAFHWMKVGGMQSGYEIFAKLQMWDECVDCIVQMGDTERAAKEIEKLIAKGYGSLKMKCIYAEIKNDKTLLKQVWKESNRKLARAQRSLGELSFYQTKDYDQAIKHFRKALNINSYNFRSWFMMGCAQMRLGRIEDAVKSLGQCVSVNEKDAEAWGNLAGCLIQLKKFTEAMAALEQGVKFSGSDWKLWSNLMAIALKNKKFFRFYTCIERLIGLNQHSLIDEQIVSKVIQTFQYSIETVTIETLRSLTVLKDRVNRLFEFLMREIGQRYYIWEGLARFTILTEQYDEAVYELSEKSEELRLTKDNKKQGYLDDIAQFRMKSCQMLMIVGWERDIQICKQLLHQGQQLNQDYKLVKSEDARINIRMLLDTLKSKIEVTLEQKVQFE